MSIEDIKEIAALFNISAPIITALVVLAICVPNADKLLVLLSKIQNLCSFASSRARKGAIANAIRGNILGASKKLKLKNIGVLCSDLKIDWIKEETQESFLSNKQVIIRMSQKANPHQNYVTAVNAYVSQALLPHAKRYVDDSILTMSKASISRLIIVNSDADAIEYFDDNVLYPLIGENNDARELYDRLCTIDKNGMFINILLNEYSKAAKKIYPDRPDPLLIAESSEFLTFLYRIAMRASGDINELVFNREYFKVGISLTANATTIMRSGLRPYIRHMTESVENGIETIYVFGLGRKMLTAQRIIEAFEETSVSISKTVTHYYKHRSNDSGKSINGVCYEVRIYQKPKTRSKRKVADDIR